MCTLLPCLWPHENRDINKYHLGLDLIVAIQYYQIAYSINRARASPPLYHRCHHTAKLPTTAERCRHQHTHPPAPRKCGKKFEKNLSEKIFHRKTAMRSVLAPNTGSFCTHTDTTSSKELEKVQRMYPPPLLSTHILFPPIHSPTRQYKVLCMPFHSLLFSISPNHQSWKKRTLPHPPVPNRHRPHGLYQTLLLEWHSLSHSMPSCRCTNCHRTIDRHRHRHHCTNHPLHCFPRQCFPVVPYAPPRQSWPIVSPPSVPSFQSPWLPSSPS
mmetsp:Transcript_22282/g.38238  ORF Transcript_22282/g.38238 Transcript_22282/m.38238 type:complete len:270 (+) Transcript_22282:102-911(+)